MRNLTERLDSIVRRGGGHYILDNSEGELHITIYTDDHCHNLIVGEYGFEGLNSQLTQLENFLTSEGV